MYKVVFEHEDKTVDEIFVESLAEAEEYQMDEDFAYIETV